MGDAAAVERLRIKVPARGNTSWIAWDNVVINEHDYAARWHAGYFVARAKQNRAWYIIDDMNLGAQEGPFDTAEQAWIMLRLTK